MASSLTLRALKCSRPPTFGRTTVTAFRTFSASSSRLEHYSDADLGTFKKVTAGPESSGRLVLVDFYANWCQPCHVLSPILKRISADPNVKSGTGLPVDVMTINTESEDGMELGLRYKITALPTVIAFREGKAAMQFVGALPEPQVMDFLSQV